MAGETMTESSFISFHIRRISLSVLLICGLMPAVSAQETAAPADPPTAPPAGADATEAATGDQAASAEQGGDAKETSATPAEPVELLPFKIRPYEVLVTTGFAPDCLPEERLRAQLITQVPGLVLERNCYINSPEIALL